LRLLLLGSSQMKLLTPLHWDSCSWAPLKWSYSHHFIETPGLLYAPRLMEEGGK
jgi:hypothetical protein